MNPLNAASPEASAGPGQTRERVPEQSRLPWAIAFAVSWSSLKRRVFRSLITMTGVILAIAFLTYMLVSHDLVRALVRANHAPLNLLLQRAGVDIFRAGGPDSRMLLLIGLSLLTCLVGIVNAMLMSVTERVREIGTLKCLGALNSFILQIYFIEASLQGVLGTVLGMLLGLVVACLTTLYTYHGYVMLCFPAAAVIGSLGVSAVIGSLISVVAAIAPARWAAGKQPVEAMRVEQ